MSRESSKGPTIERLMQQWRTPLGYEPSYSRFMKILRHLGISDGQALTEEGQAKIEAELLSRKWTRREPLPTVDFGCIGVIDGSDIPALNTTLNALGLSDNDRHEILKAAATFGSIGSAVFWQRLDVEVLVLGGDPARARRIVEHLVLTTRCTPDLARRRVLDALAEGRELAEPPGNS